MDVKECLSKLQELKSNVDELHAKVDGAFEQVRNNVNSFDSIKMEKVMQKAAVELNSKSRSEIFPEI